MFPFISQYENNYTVKWIDRVSVLDRYCPATAIRIVVKHSDWKPWHIATFHLVLKPHKYFEMGQTDRNTPCLMQREVHILMSAGRRGEQSGIFLTSPYCSAHKQTPYRSCVKAEGRDLRHLEFSWLFNWSDPGAEFHSTLLTSLQAMSISKSARDNVMDTMTWFDVVCWWYDAMPWQRWWRWWRWWWRWR